MDRKRKIGCTLLVMATLTVLGGMLGCRIDHYALVRVSVKDIDTDECFTNGTCSVKCHFPCWDLSRAFSWEGQRYSCEEKQVSAADGGVKWFWGHGNTAEAHAYVQVPPSGYYTVRGRGDENVAHFSTLMTWIPIPLHLPPVQTATVYVKRQMNPIEAKICRIVETDKLRSNGVFLALWRPRSEEMVKRTNSYEVTASYDCMIGDYCKPLGKGEVADIIFRHAYDYRGMKTNQWGNLVHDFTRRRTMVFPGKGNGFVFRKRPTTLNGHEFTKEDFTAPFDGYAQEHESSFCAEGASGPTDAFFDFRIRCKYDADGNLTSCHYGRWKGRYSYYLNLSADFYVNPKPMDRNLELVNGMQSDGGGCWWW